MTETLCRWFCDCRFCDCRFCDRWCDVVAVAGTRIAVVVGTRTRRYSTFLAAFSNLRFLASMVLTLLLDVGVLGGGAGTTTDSAAAVLGSNGAVTKLMSDVGVVSCSSCPL